MEKKRLQKYESLIHSVLNEFLTLEGKSIIKDNFVTIMGVEVTSNLSLAKVYLSFLNEKTQNICFEAIKKSKGKFRYFLGNKIRNQARKIPEIKFILDTSEYSAYKIDRLIAKLDIPKISKE